ncbi:MAG: DUF3365 domain-containing protein [Thermodesulfobacteriota bacterium]
MTGSSIAKTRRYLALICVLFLIGTAISLAHDIRQTREDRYRLAVSWGEALFRTVVAARSWNASHGGVYVPVTDKTRPNEYLASPDRDVRTTTGVSLTKVNPAYMTRLVGDILAREGFVVHITGLKTMRPGNAPDDWERATLADFGKGVPAAHALQGPSGNRVFRYMEPLKAEAACLECHRDRGYRVGDILGGISVAFPYVPFDRSAAKTTGRDVATHLLLLTLALSVLFFLGRRILGLVESLEEARREISTLEGILPMCSHCKKIRKEGAKERDPEAWVPVDSYIMDRSAASVSHGICPECLDRHYPGHGRPDKG